MRIRFWGTRGSVPTPGPRTVRYGGNTACVQIQTNGGAQFILDSGTGIRELGLYLAHRGERVRANILLGHTHWDHISGFPFFGPALVAGNEFAIYGARDLDRSLRETLAGQMHYTYFPLPLGNMLADMEFHELDEGEVLIDGARIASHYLNHTAVCLGYRLQADAVAIAYITDHEPYGFGSLEDPDSSTVLQRLGPEERFLHGGDRQLIEFVRGVDLLVQDAQYTPEEYLSKRGWGHGTPDYATDIAIAAEVKRLALFHHEPQHSDEQIDQMVAFARDRAHAVGSRLEIFGAAEGGELSL